MFIQLDQKNEKTAGEIRKIQREAYQIEADLIGFDGIPQLAETVAEVQKNEEIFIGYIEEELLGFISYKEKNGLIDIHRLAIDPRHFRKGIAKSLLTFLLEQFSGREVIVSTGTANIPARKLYESFGFQEQEIIEVAPEITCTVYRKNS